MLIDKEELITALEEFADTLTVIGGSYIRSAIRLAIDPMKETDAVPVIRCKDCKYSHMTFDGECKYCDIWFPMEKTYMDGNYFCASAERREDDREM